MLQITDLSKQYGSKILFEDASVTLSSPMRVGIVGANGAGKSTLLRIVSGDESADSGQVKMPKNAKLGVLGQDHFKYESVRILDVVIQGNAELWKTIVRRNELLLEPDSGMELAEMEYRIFELGGSAAESEAAQILEGLGILAAVHEEPLSMLSGGYKLRVLLAQVLFGDPQILLLDEPTNHLDLDSIQWLENFLKQRKGLTVFISHDRMFLNRVSTHILDVDFRTLTLYTGNFDAHLVEKELRQIQLEKQKTQQESKIADLQTFVDRFGSKAALASRAQSKLKQIEKMEEIEIPESSRRKPSIRFRMKRPSGKNVLSVTDISHSYGEKAVLKDVNFDLYRGQRLGIIGPNGVGKSTLLKILVGDLRSTDGEFSWGHEAHIGYFAQDHHTQVAGKVNSLDWLYAFDTTATQTQMRGILGAVLLGGDEALKPVDNLSGGEAARLLLARMLVEQPNILILDEPTNHLDLESIEALSKALCEFEGTVLFVSHDRQFVSEIATQILELRPDRVDHYPGSFTEYLQQRGKDHLERGSGRPSLKQISERKEAAPEKRPAAAAPAEKKQNPAVNKRRVADLESRIEALEADILKLEQTLADPGSYSRMKPSETQQIGQDLKTKRSELERVLEEWEVAST